MMAALRLSPFISFGNLYKSGPEDIGVGYAKPFGVLSWHAGQKARSTASVCCQRSRQRGPEKVRKQSIINLSQY